MKIIVLILSFYVLLFSNSLYKKAKEAEHNKEYKKAEQLYRSSCDKGNDQGCLGLVDLYFNKKSTNIHDIVAFKISKMLCKKNNAQGCYNLGRFFNEFGHSIEPDITEAAKWYRKAANQGYAPVQFNLGNMYYYGQGVRQDYKEAVKWWKKSCEGGFQLGCKYSKNK